MRKIALGLLLCTAMIAYPVAKIRRERRKVAEVCASARVGGPVAELEARARARGLRLLRPVPEVTLAMGGWLFARAICEVRHANGAILSNSLRSPD